MKTSELTGAALDWAVAECELLGNQEHTLVIDTDTDGTKRVNYGGMYPEWSTNWAQGGEIIERERISLIGEGGEIWFAEWGWIQVFGDTPLEAAMRTYVASKFGDDIEIPKELL